MLQNLDKIKREVAEKSHFYEMFGNHIESLIHKELEKASIRFQQSSKRVKTIDSVIGKIERKNYDDPLSQIEDFVGVRIVLLTIEDAQATNDIIRNNLIDLTCSDARDPDQEVKNNPHNFDYQSWHFIVRNKKDIKIGDIIIPVNTPCEVQIRTIAQHAYAELVHDSIYKAKGPVPVKAKRFAASCSALLETVDHLFCETLKLLEEERRKNMKLLDKLKEIYREKINQDFSSYNEELNLYILDHFNKYIDHGVWISIAKCENFSRFYENISERRAENLFWHQPVCLLMYILVFHKRRAILSEWPLANSKEQIITIYTDLGISIPE